VQKVTSGFVDTARETFGLFHIPEVREEGVIEILFELTQDKSHGACLKKVEIWSVASTSPRPALAVRSFPGCR
jgi:hypothetical protein